MDPQQPQQPQQPIAPPQPPVQGPDPNYVQPQPQPASVPQPEYQPQAAEPYTPQIAAPAPAPEAPVVPVTQPLYQSQPQPAPVQPAGPAAPVPTQPGFPSQPQNGVFGSGPAAPYGPQPAKGKGKLFALIGIIVAGLIVIGVGVWALMTFVFASIPLETYKGDGYSILVPKDYQKDETSNSVTFESKKQKGSNGQDVYSALYVASTDIPSSSTKDETVAMYDKLFNENTFKQSLSSTGSSSSSEVKNFKVDKSDYQGFTARKYTADSYVDGKNTGQLKMLIVFTDKKIYVVSVGAHSQVEPGFRAAADKILNSLKIDE